MQPKRSILTFAVAISAMGVASAPTRTYAQAPRDLWQPVDQALGRTGTTQPDGVRRFGFPRSDLKVQLDGVTIKPALALGSWLAFKPMGQSGVVMGDLALTSDEVVPVMTELLKDGLKVTALHNHLLRSTPQIMYMHVLGHGSPVQLASSLRAALALSHTPLQPPATAPQAALELDTAALDRIIGSQAMANGGVYQFTVPRREKILADSMETPASMGTGTAINFQPVGGGRAAVTGDFVLVAAEVSPVMRSLRSNGVEVTALHNHMVGEQPALYFMHFWAVADARQLATSLRAALDLTNVKR
jgi:hypothetical protein